MGGAWDCEQDKNAHGAATVGTIVLGHLRQTLGQERWHFPQIVPVQGGGVGSEGCEQSSLPSSGELRGKAHRPTHTTHRTKTTPVGGQRCCHFSTAEGAATRGRLHCIKERPAGPVQGAHTLPSFAEPTTRSAGLQEGESGGTKRTTPKKHKTRQGVERSGAPCTQQRCWRGLTKHTHLPQVLSGKKT